MAETIEILGNPDTMRQIAESKEDIKHGRTKRVDSVSDMIDELRGFGLESGKDGFISDSDSQALKGYAVTA